MTALGKVHAHHRVAGREQCEIHRHIRLCARVGLNIGKIRAEQFTRAAHRDILYNIHTFATAVIAFARIAFGVFVGQHTTHRRHYRGRNDVFAGNQFQISLLAGKFFAHRRTDFGVVF